MYYLCKLQVGDECCYTITTSVDELIASFNDVDVSVGILTRSYEYGVCKCQLAKTLFEGPVTLLVDGKVYTNVFEILEAIELLGPGLLGWRIRRLGRKLGTLGLKLRYRRMLRRARHRALWAKIKGWFLCS